MWRTTIALTFNSHEQFFWKTVESLLEQWRSCLRVGISWATWGEGYCNSYSILAPWMLIPSSILFVLLLFPSEWALTNKRSSLFCIHKHPPCGWWCGVESIESGQVWTRKDPPEYICHWKPSNPWCQIWYILEATGTSKWHFIFHIIVQLTQITHLHHLHQVCL